MTNSGEKTIDVQNLSHTEDNCLKSGFEWAIAGMESNMHRSVIESLEDRMTGARSTHGQTHMLQI